MSSPDEDDALTDHRNLTAVDAISERLAEVTRLAEKLDRKLYEAGARTRITKDPVDEEITTSTRTISPLSPGTVIESSIDKKPGDNLQEISHTSPEPEEINTEDYMTATEGSTTPMARSRSESFVTMSECDDAMPDAYR